MNAVRTLSFLLVLLAITLALLLAGATGLGALLHRLMPAVGLGTAVLIGVVALSVSAHFVLSVLGRAHSLQEEIDEADLKELEEMLAAAAHRPARGQRSRR
ncbi:MAG TPA: hypothetical protein VHG08_07250 [Longimicrobium sp.]|nr:hypothetical protein [Longimicrobium sp.]